MGSTPGHSAQPCPACLSGTLAPRSALFRQAAAAFHPHLAISPIFEERGTKTSLSTAVPPAHSCAVRHQERSAHDSSAHPKPKAPVPQVQGSTRKTLQHPNPLRLSTLQEHIRILLTMGITLHGVLGNTEPPLQAAVH